MVPMQDSIRVTNPFLILFLGLFVHFVQRLEWVFKRFGSHFNYWNDLTKGVQSYYITEYQPINI